MRSISILLLQALIVAPAFGMPYIQGHITEKKDHGFVVRTNFQTFQIVLQRTTTMVCHKHPIDVDHLQPGDCVEVRGPVRQHVFYAKKVIVFRKKSECAR